MRPANKITKLTESLSLAECHDGFWLYDKTRGMNLSMRAKTEQEAFVESLTYYQKRLSDVEKAYHDMKTDVDNFVSRFSEDDDS